MTNEEILKLAKKSGLLTNSATEPSAGQKDFYKQAFNAGLEAAAKLCEAKFDFCGNEILAADAIRSLKDKP